MTQTACKRRRTFVLDDLVSSHIREWASGGSSDEVTAAYTLGNLEGWVVTVRGLATNAWNTETDIEVNTESQQQTVTNLRKDGPLFRSKQASIGMVPEEIVKKKLKMVLITGASGEKHLSLRSQDLAFPRGHLGRQFHVTHTSFVLTTLTAPMRKSGSLIGFTLSSKNAHQQATNSTANTIQGLGSGGPMRELRNFTVT